MPCEDPNNNELEQGTKVFIPAEVASVVHAGEHCIVTLKVLQLGDEDAEIEFRSDEVFKVQDFDITGVLGGGT